MYGTTYMLYEGITAENSRIATKKIFCNKDGSIPDWSLGQDYNENHTLSNPCKYAGFQITWTNKHSKFRKKLN